MNEKSLGYAAFVKLVIDALEAAGVDYMIGGAVASWAWGEPRATQDLDLVVDIPSERVTQLSEELIKRDMQVPPDIILNTVLEERADLPINAIHGHSGYKADIYPYREGDELRRSALSRRKLVDLGPELGEVYLHSPEDLIIYKLWYYSLSRQTKHLRDIISILMTLGDELDFSYIEHWAEQKGVNAYWKEMLERLDEHLGSEGE
jgi:hypothetical protein